MAEKFLRCPQCGVGNFYVKDKNGALVFMNIKADGTPVLKKLSEHPPVDLDLSTISCAACSWHGTIEKLKKLSPR